MFAMYFDVKYGLMLCFSVVCVLLNFAAAFSVCTTLGQRGLLRAEKINVYMSRAADSGVKSSSWFPPRKVYDDDIFAQDDDIMEIQERSIDLVATLIRQRINERKDNTTDVVAIATPFKHKRVHQLTKGRFLDLTCTKEGEEVMERMFDCDEAAIEDDDVVRGAVMALQSLLMMGTQVGVKGPPQQLQRMVSHLYRRADDVRDLRLRDLDVWDAESIRRLKYNVDQTAGMEVLARLLRKRSTQGAFDVLVDIGAWEKHEDIALLRSGFPIRFTEDEILAAEEASSITHDPDTVLSLRKDFKELKVYTIDSASTTEIDDGLSVEVLSNEDGSTRHRYWMHIADAERWVPRNSTVFEIASRRATSHYLPTTSVPMLPDSISDLISLRQGRDVFALSLGVELLPDGSIDSSSIIVTPSRIMVDYRLSYDEVDEMLEEGVEEWQLGALLAAATKRRNHRIENGSTEGFVPNPIPQTTVSAFPDKNEPDGIGISLRFDAANNSGKNLTESAEGDETGEYTVSVSPAMLLVTEMMILAGEAIGKWKSNRDEENGAPNGSHARLDSSLMLPFRSQPPPDFKSMQRETQILNDLREGMQGDGYCHAWYARRFFKPVNVGEINSPHFGLGLDCYVQWTSPIRRFADLQVHVATKRYLRRKRVNELMKNGLEIPSALTENDLGCPVPVAAVDKDGQIIDYECSQGIYDSDLNFNQGMGLVRASRTLQRRSQEYWVFEYIRRVLDRDPEEAVFDAIVLGCVNPEKYQYAVFLPQLGLEHRYLSEVGSLRPGMTLSLRVLSVFPRLGLLTLTLNNA